MNSSPFGPNRSFRTRGRRNNRIAPAAASARFSGTARSRQQGLRTDVWVWPNSYGSGLFGADVEEVTVPGLAGLFIPKVFTAEEVVRIDAVVSHVEQREGLASGPVGLITSFETAVSPRAPA